MANLLPLLAYTQISIIASSASFPLHMLHIAWIYNLFNNYLYRSTHVYNSYLPYVTP